VLWVIPRVVLLVLLQFSLDSVNRFRWLAFLGSEELENLIFSFSQKVILTLYLWLFLNMFRRLVMPMVYKLTTDPRSRSNNMSRLTSYLMIAANLMAFVALINIWAYSYVGVWLAGTLGTGVAISLTFILGLFTSSVLGNVLAYWVLNNVMEFEVGDRVQIGEVYGDVVNVGLFFTRIKTIKEETVSMPNLLVTGREIKNFSSVEAVLIHVPVTLGYDTEKERARALLIQCAEATEGVLHGEGKEPFVLFTELDKYTVTYEINAYTDRADQIVNIRSPLIDTILTEFARAGIKLLSPTFVSVEGLKTPM
jgi:small-conductance mechanosensitive channel